MAQQAHTKLFPKLPCCSHHVCCAGRLAEACHCLACETSLPCRDAICMMHMRQNPCTHSAGRHGTRMRALACHCTTADTQRALLSLHALRAAFSLQCWCSADAIPSRVDGAHEPRCRACGPCACPVLRHEQQRPMASITCHCCCASHWEQAPVADARVWLPSHCEAACGARCAWLPMCARQQACAIRSCAAAMPGTMLSTNQGLDEPR